MGTTNKMLKYCTKCGKQLPADYAFCTKCGTALGNAAPAQNTSQDQQTVLYQGVCLQRLSGMTTVPGDAIITPQGLFYYKRSKFSKQIGNKPCDLFVDSRNVANIQQSYKNMNQVMQLTMNDGSVLEFYSPKFSQMFAAMNEAIRQSRM
ncbi:MAG TPA: zinc ribbon domain-containing protein [Clostridiaceae bacterium]|jgi:hypothetical protein|nr:zinc ribbon domain-containing protein [Clostridiaceae bacterium]